jgi:hypothetical protein
MIPFSAQGPELLKSFALAQQASIDANSVAHGAAKISFLGRTLSLSIFIVRDSVLLET